MAVTEEYQVGDDTFTRAGRESRGIFVSSLQVILRSVNSTIGLGIVLVMLLAGLLAPWIAPHDPTAVSLEDRTAAPSSKYLLGTDRNGRDILSRLLAGARLSLILGGSAVAIAAVVGVSIGLASGYYGGWLDVAIMRTVDVLLAFPLYLIALVVIAVLGPSFFNTILAIAIATAPSFARLARGETLALRSAEYIEAARAIGVSTRAILFRHVLPNILGPLMVIASLGIGTAILVESSLSFLGLGPPPPTPSWGSMINEGLQVMRRAYWVPLFPGLAITFAVLGFNLLGDGLRDALDPRMRGR